MTRRSLLLLVTMAFALVTASGMAMAASQLDQQQPSSSGENLIDDNEHQVQSFTAGVSGALEEVSVYVGCCKDKSGNTGGTPPGDLQVNIVENPGSIFGTIIESSTLPASFFSTDGALGWEGIGFASPPSVEAGKQYGINVRSDSTGSSYYLWGYNAPGGYSRGELLYFDYDRFGWVSRGDHDAAFQTYVAPIDKTAPNVTKSPTQTLTSGSSLSTSTVPVKLSWSATDSTSAIARYELQQSVDGGAWSGVTLSSATQTTITRQLTPGKTYKFQIRAQDGAGNWSDWKPGSPFKVNLFQQANSAISYTGTWSTQSLTSFSGGSVKYASTPGTNPVRTAKLTQNKIQNIGWVSTKGPNRGKAEVKVDGVPVATSDLYNSSTQYRKVVYVKNGLVPSVSHSLETKPLGTQNASSSGTRVDMDALVVLSSP